jgi:hypothetical protein
MEYIPFLHANQIFNIACEEDLKFTEIRAILDKLLLENAFHLDDQEAVGHFKIEFEGDVFEVWVAEMEVFIHKVVGVEKSG